MPQKLQSKTSNEASNSNLFFIGYGTNYYRLLIKEAIYHINDAEELMKIANYLLSLLNKETREKIHNELAFLNSKNSVDEATLSLKLKELTELVSPLLSQLGKFEISLGYIVALLPVFDIIIARHSRHYSKKIDDLMKIEELIIDIAEMIEPGSIVWQTNSRIKYYSHIRDVVKHIKIKINTNQNNQNIDDDIGHVIRIIRKFIAIQNGKKTVAYWAALIAVKLKERRITYVDDFETILKLLSINELLTMLMHYDPYIVKNIDNINDLPQELKKEIVKFVNYWLNEL